MEVTMQECEGGSGTGEASTPIKVGGSMSNWNITGKIQTYYQALKNKIALTII
jgi:hypothetical protein